jgi:hypothetical protein
MTDERDVKPEPGVSLTIRFPLVLGPDERNPHGIVLMGWAADTGELLICHRLQLEEMDEGMAWIIVKRLERRAPCILVAIYDGDDGAITNIKAIRQPADDDNDEPPAEVMDALAQANADPDQPCALCDGNVPEGADFDRTKVHRECLLANVIGPLGHHLDHGFWCENMDDPHCGRGVRQANLDLAALVDRHGLRAVVTGDFPKDDLPIRTGGSGA